MFLSLQSFSGLCGALLIVSGVLGAGVCGVIVDKTKRFEEVAKTCYVVGLFGGIVFTEVQWSGNVFHMLLAKPASSSSPGLAFLNSPAAH